MLTDEYNYDLDMQLKAEEAFDKGAQEGAQQKAINDAITLIKKYKVSPEEASKDMNAPMELVLERLK